MQTRPHLYIRDRFAPWADAAWLPRRARRPGAGVAAL